jgi:hypothetical protein
MLKYNIASILSLVLFAFVALISYVGNNEHFLSSEIKHKHACCLLHAGVLLGLFFNPEDDNNKFL